MKGEESEDQAVNCLKQKGYEILDRNFRVPGGEIDIIARHTGTIVFVEVKARRTADFGYPEEYVTRKKKKFILRTARRYIAEKGLYDSDIRFDVVAILDSRIEHYENVGL